MLDDLIVIYERKNDRKNVKRSNDEIDKMIEATDKNIASVKDFLSSSRKQSSPVPDKRVKAIQQELSLLEHMKFAAGRSWSNTEAILSTIESTAKFVGRQETRTS